MPKQIGSMYREDDPSGKRSRIYEFTVPLSEQVGYEELVELISTGGGGGGGGGGGCDCEEQLAEIQGALDGFQEHADDLSIHFTIATLNQLYLPIAPDDAVYGYTGITPIKIWEETDTATPTTLLFVDDANTPDGYTVVSTKQVEIAEPPGP